MKTIQAELSNPQHPEYGVVTIPFPIPDKEYKHVLELLESLEVGDYVKKDCRIGTLIDAPPVLRRLEQTLINLDKLDYLIKRLDSFDDYEMEQFQALAYAKGVSDVPDMINLTFNSQQVTVISDFSDLEAAGKQHYLTTYGGFAGVEEYNRVDGRQESLNLLCNQDGKVTPYGVLFENDLKMEQLYNGSSLPLYAYNPSILEVTLEDDTGQKLELLLPKPEMALIRSIKRAEMDEDRIWLPTKVCCRRNWMLLLISNMTASITSISCAALWHSSRSRILSSWHLLCSSQSRRMLPPCTIWQIIWSCSIFIPVFKARKNTADT